MNSYGQTQLERFNSPSFLCVQLQHNEYELKVFCCFILFFSFFFFLSPSHLSERTEPAIIPLWHILWILWISSAKSSVNVYVVVYLKLYLHMRLYVISYRVLILYIFNKCDFYQTRALFIRSHQTNSLTWFCFSPWGDWSVPCLQLLWVGPWEAPGPRHDMPHSGNEMLKVTPWTRRVANHSLISWHCEGGM